MRRYLLLAATISLAPFAAAAQGVPAPVITETTRATGTAITDGIKSNMELIDKDKAQPAPPAMPSSPAGSPDQAQPTPPAIPNPSPSPSR